MARSYAKRTDNNHAEIRNALRKLGYITKDTSAFGRGFPDLLVRGRSRAVMLEIKNGDEGLTAAEKDFFDLFHGIGLYIVRSIDEAIEIVRRECNF